MVNVLKKWLVLGMSVLLFAQHANAQSTLTASVDRNKIYENDSFTLTLAGEVDIEFSFGGIMSFGQNQIQSPELSELQKDFEILDQNQSYSMRSINGDTKAQVKWLYTLAPKRTGNLEIPAIEYQDATSQPVAIEVLAGKAPRNTDTPPLVFMEAEVDKTSAYVQEQVMYTMRLYAADHLATGDLSEPAPNDAIVESLGDTKKYYRMAYNQRYEVRERQYLLFPQKSGPLTIEAQSFNGMLIDTRTRRRVRVRETSDEVTVDVKPPPASFTGDIWLPATSFEMTEKWDKEPYGLAVGDSVTRTIELNALGLLGSALPPLAMEDINGLKVYPDQPVVESYQHDTGVQSQRQETSALVAISATEVTLPEIRIPWWDTVNDVARVAVIPSRPFEISPNPEQSQAPLNTATAPIDQAPNSIIDLTTIDQHDASQNSLQAGAIKNAGSSNNQPWYLIISLLIAGWISTTWILLRRQADIVKAHPPSISPNQEEDRLYEQLVKAVKNESNDWPKFLIEWMKLFSDNVGNIDDLRDIDETLHQLARDFELQLYSPGATGNENFDKNAILKAIKMFKKPEKKNKNTNALQPMYP